MFTYDEWMTKGRHVLYGSKATSIDGIPKFSKEQTGIGTTKMSAKRHHPFNPSGGSRSFGGRRCRC